MKKRNLLLGTLLLAASFALAQSHTLTYDWSSVLKFKLSSAAMWCDVSADGHLLTLSRFQTKKAANANDPDDVTGTFFGQTLTGPASANTSGANSIVLTKSDFNGNLLWMVTTDRGDVSNDLNNAIATKDGGVFLALTVRHTEKSDETDNILLRIKGTQNTEQTILWERVKGTDGAVAWIHQPIFVKIDADGKIQWVKRGEVGYEPAPAKPDKLIGTAFRIDGVTEDADGNFYVGGCIARKMTVDGVVINYHNVSNQWSGDFVQYREGCSFLLKLNKDGNALSAETSGGEAKTDCTKNMLIADGKLYLIGTVTGKADKTYSWGNQTILPATTDGVFVLKKDLASGQVEWLSYFPASKFINIEELRLSQGQLIAIGRFTGNVVLNTETNFQSTPHTALIFTVDATTGAVLKGAKGDARINYTGLFFKDNHIWAYGYGSKSVLDVYKPDLTLVESYQDMITGGTLTTYNCAQKGNKLALIFRGKTPMNALGNHVILEKESIFDKFMTGVATFTLTNQPTVGITNISDDMLLACSTDKATLHITLASKAVVTVHSSMGIRIAHTVMESGTSTLSLPRGIYIVEALGKVVKVAVP